MEKSAVKITAYILSCPEREEIRQQTLTNMEVTDWNDTPYVEIDNKLFVTGQERQVQTAWRLLQRAVADAPDFILFLEDDLQFNRYLRHNLEHWLPLTEAQPGGYFFGSLYNPVVTVLEAHPEQSYFIANPDSVYGSQAFVLSLATARFIVEHWAEVIGMQDIKMSRLAAQLSPIYYHTPSLVQHVGAQSVWGGHYHYTRDYQANWESPSLSKISDIRAATTEIPFVDRSKILKQMQGIDGWLDETEADLLITVTQRATHLKPRNFPVVIVEIGSYCGKSTIVFALTLQQLGLDNAHVYAIDSYDGRITDLEQNVTYTAPTFEQFKHNIQTAGVMELVEPIQACSTEVVWNQQIGLLFIDGLHDYASVQADFNHFAPWVMPDGFISFHDYASYFPGVRQFVDELLDSEDFQGSDQVKSLVVLRRR